MAWEFVLPCDSGATVSTASFGVDLPSGQYAYTVKGACVIDLSLGRTVSIPVGTPCSLPEVGTIPCASTTVHNVPFPVCWTVTEGQLVEPCTGTIAPTCTMYVAINGACLPTNGVVWHPGGPMTAQFADSNYTDNVGAFTVTVVWTPL